MRSLSTRATLLRADSEQRSGPAPSRRSSCGAPPQIHMGRTLAGDMLHCFVAQCGQIDTCVESFTGTHENRSDRQVRLIDQPGAQILPNRRDAAAHPNVALARGIPGLLQRRVNTVGDEPKLGAACHALWTPGMMSQHEDGGVIGRLIASPALPAFIRPRAADGPEHIAAEYPGAQAGHRLRGDLVVDARLATFKALHLSPGSSGEEPLHQRDAADPERILKILIGPRTEAVD